MAEVMATLNRAASEQMLRFGARAATDVTCFGLAGHALAIARESRVDLAFDWDKVEVLPGAREALRLGLVPAGAYRNREAYGVRLVVRRADAEDVSLLVCDPQTSGGLLVSLPASQAEPYARSLRDEGSVWASVVGEVLPGGGRVIVQ